MNKIKTFLLACVLFLFCCNSHTYKVKNVSATLKHIFLNSIFKIDIEKKNKYYVQFMKTFYPPGAQLSKNTKDKIVISNLEVIKKLTNKHLINAYDLQKKRFKSVIMKKINIGKKQAASFIGYLGNLSYGKQKYTFEELSKNAYLMKTLYKQYLNF